MNEILLRVKMKSTFVLEILTISSNDSEEVDDKVLHGRFRKKEAYGICGDVMKYELKIF